MKQLVLMVLSLGISTLVWAQMPNTPRIRVLNDKANLGSINEDGGGVPTTFKFVNVGKKPLKIINVLTSCGCTTPEWTKDEVKTGDTGYVVAVYNPQNKEGSFSKTLTVITNGDPQSVTLTVMGTVYASNKQMKAMFPAKSGNMLMTSNALELPAQKEDKTDTVWLGIYNPTEEMMFVEMIVTPPMMKANVDRVVLKPQGGDNIMFTYNGKLTKGLGTYTDSIYLVTSDKTEPSKLVTIKAKVVQNFDALTPEQRANAPELTLKQVEGDMGQLYQGETGVFVFEFTNTGKSDLVVRKVLADCKCITAVIPQTPIKKGAKGKVTISYNSKGKHRNIEEKVTLVVNDPKHPETVLKVRAKVVIPGKEPVTY